MLPAILGLGGLTAKIIATAVIPRVVRAISQSFSVTRPPEPCSPPAVEGISSAPEPAPAPVLSGISGTPISSRKWGYAGLWHHGPSGLDLATYRLYDAKNKRWISRDPLGEGTDRTLYSYGWNNPISNIDPSGLETAPRGGYEGGMQDPFGRSPGDYRNDAIDGAVMIGIGAGTVYEAWLLVAPSAEYIYLRWQSRGGGAPRTCPTTPPEAYNRKKHYGRTPTKADRKAIGAGKGEVADHDPPLVKRYYEGDPNAVPPERPGIQMSPAERAASAADRSRMRVQPAGESNSQGGTMSQYSRQMRRRLGL